MGIWSPRSIYECMKHATVTTAVREALGVNAKKTNKDWPKLVARGHSTVSTASAAWSTNGSVTVIKEQVCGDNAVGSTNKMCLQPVTTTLASLPSFLRLVFF